MILYILIGILVIVLLLKIFSKSIFPIIHVKVGTIYQQVCLEHKAALFVPLDEMAEAAGPFKVKVLEIGGGQGANFKLVKNPVDWTLTEPNLNFAKHFEENREKHSGTHKINDLIEAVGEDLSKFEDESFDVVIITNVFCSVDSIDKTVMESQRVLKPGGKVFFFEHIAAPNGTMLNYIQRFLTASGLWGLLFDRCCLDRSPHETLRRKFSKCEVVYFDFKHIINPFVRPNCYGWATK